MASLGHCSVKDCARMPKWVHYRSGQAVGSLCGPHKQSFKPGYLKCHNDRFVKLARRS